MYLLITSFGALLGSKHFAFGEHGFASHSSLVGTHSPPLATKSALHAQVLVGVPAVQMSPLMPQALPAPLQVPALH